MAIYNLDFSSLESLLNRSLSPGAERAIIDAIKFAGIGNIWSGKFGVEIENTSGAYTVPLGAQIFLDLGANNTVQVATGGGTLIAAGDQPINLTDIGPGGDTLLGGAGANWLEVTGGQNLLIGGSGENTLVGGGGNDTLIGGGSSLLQAGPGGSTLIGGLISEAWPAIAGDLENDAPWLGSAGSGSGGGTFNAGFVAQAAENPWLAANSSSLNYAGVASELRSDAFALGSSISGLRGGTFNAGFIPQAAADSSLAGLPANPSSLTSAGVADELRSAALALQSQRFRTKRRDV